MPLLTLSVNANETNSIQFLPIIEVPGDQMPGFEKDIIQKFKDSDGNPLPVIFRGAAKNWPVASWTPEFFAQNFPNEMITLLPQHPENFYKTHEDGYITIEREYFTQTLLYDHIQEITKNPLNAGYLPASIDHNKTSLNPNLISLCPFTDNERFLIKHFNNLSELSNFPQPTLSPTREPRRYILFIGSNQTISGLHSHESNFLCQIYGEKLLVLVHPKFTSHLQCYTAPDGYSGACKANVLKPDFASFPQLSQVEAYVTTLRPGDVAYFPDGWLHDLQAISTSISLGSGF